MGLFDAEDDEPIILENADLDCSPQGESVTEAEVSKIDEYLDPGEKVHYLATNSGGRFTMDGAKDNNVGATRTAVTDKRIIIKLARRGPLTINANIEERTIDYSGISVVDLSIATLKTKLKLDTPTRTYGIGIGSIPDEEAREMKNFIRNIIDEEKNQGTANKSKSDPFEQIEKLQKLLDSGAITEEEYNKKKEELMSQI